MRVAYLAGFAAPQTCNSLLKIPFTLIFLALIFSSTLIQTVQIHGQSDPFNSTSTCAKLAISGIAATATGVDPLNPPSYAFDQNLNTRWSNLGLGSWIQVDLGLEKAICSVGINWYRGDERINTFVISASSDGKTFTDVFSGKSDGKSLAEQSYSIQQRTARFIKITVIGNTQNNWVSISELKVYGYKVPSESCTTSPILKVTASGSSNGYPPSNAIDSNLNTVWSNYGVGSSISLDLGTSKNVCSVDIAWYKGNERQNNFVISTSSDGLSFKAVLTAKSSGNSLSYEKYTFADNFARYIKITVNGNTQNNYASIAEARVQAASVGQPEVKCTTGIIQNIKTSGSQSSFPGTNVLDKDLNTRWSNFGIGSWIQVDMGTIKKICAVNIGWYNGNERQNSFMISTSNDGINFNTVLSSKSSGTTRELEKYDFADTNARYVRITVNGNTLNEWASITELSVDVVSIAGSTFDIGAAGDWGSSRNDNWKKTVQLLIDNNVELVLGLGDYSYGTVGEFKPVVDRLKAAGIPMKGAKGDHDSGNYAELFGQPSMAYAFDAGPARIILIDSYKSSSTNAAFLEKELIATRQPWKIVVVTSPLYTSPSAHPPDTEQRRALQPLIDKYKVDVVMWGDNHNYERIKFADKPTVFIQSGTAGRSHYSFGGKIAGSMYQNDDDYGFTNLKIGSTSITGQFIAHGDKVLDTFTITK